MIVRLKITRLRRTKADVPTQAKIMMLGEIGVGKSSISRRVVHRRFDPIYKPTIGVDVYRYTVEPPPAGHDVFKLIIWDTDGNFGNAIFRHVYVNEADAALIVCDRERKGTFETAAKLLEGFQDALPGRYVAVVINKCDDPNAPVELPAAWLTGEVPVIKTSAKTGFNIDKAFHDAAAAIARRRR